MRKATAMVLGGLSREQARRAMLSLLAMGLDAEARHENGPRWQIFVAEEDAAGALPIVEEAVAAADAAGAPQPAPPAAPLVRIWTLANSSSTIALAALCIAIHVAVHRGAGPSPRSTMLDAGAIAPWLVSSGEPWRLVSAAFLHFDIKHLVGNMGSLFFLGPPLASTIGHARMLLLFVTTAVAGNVVSQLFGVEAAVKAGASGGICGLLGALAGVALARMASAEDFRERRPAWQTLGALVALFGMIVGFEPGRDHYAHVGGLVAGLLFGALLARGTREDAA